ncbi:MAG TPA: 3-hydroxyacyl-CoA dehydrogenase family protein [Chloroflexota bacterium]
MDIRKIGVVGSGQMGGGIAQVCASAGFETITHDLFLTRDNPKLGVGAIRARLQRQVDQGKLDKAALEQTMSRLSDTTDLQDLAGCDLIVEAVIERLEDKAAVFRTLDQACPQHSILATNTSSISITELAEETSRPDRVIGTHFFNPPPLMPIVEVVRGLQTSEATVDNIRGFVEQIGKRSIFSRDRAGFIVNYLLVPYLLDAMRMYENGWATKEDIDDGMKYGCNLPMGPLTLSDFIGLDTVYYIALVLLEEFREPRYAPPPLLKRMVLAGKLGRKTGAGFYSYDS